jgi:putative transposase
MIKNGIKMSDSRSDFSANSRLLSIAVIVVTELKNRGVQDIFIACVDGLKGFPEAIETVYPKATVQLCIVHMVRNSLNYVGWQKRKLVTADLKRVYTASTIDECSIN